VKQIYFEQIIPESDGKIQLRVKGETLPYYYFCNKPTLIFGSNIEDASKPFEFYSNNLTPHFQKDFCTTSVGDKPVPKATFASANKPQPSNLS